MRIITTLFLAIILTAGFSNAQQVSQRGQAAVNLSDYVQNANQSQKLFGKTHVLVSGHAEHYVSRGACDTVFMEDFQSQMIPSGWSNIDGDGLTDANGRDQDWWIRAESVVGSDTNWAASASSWFSPAGVANNWLITDSFTVCDPSLYLIWKSAPFEGPTYADGYKVKISTTNNMLASFTTTLATFAEGVGATAVWSTPGTQHPNFSGNNGILTEWQVSLSAYAGQTIYIAFQHDSDDDNIISLDDIMVTKLPDQELEAISGSYSSEYPITPLNQVQSYTFSGMIGNNGVMAATNCSLAVNVNSGAFTDNASIASLPAFTDTNLTMSNAFTPSAVGAYNAFFTASMMQADPLASNDTLSNSFIVSDTTYARDNGVITGALGIGGGVNPASGIIGQEFELFTADTLTSISFFLNAPTVGDTIWPFVLPLAAGVPDDFNPLYSFTPVVVSDPNPMMYNIAVANGLALPVGDFVIALRESAPNNMTLGTATNKFTAGKGWVFLDSQGAWANSEDYSFNVSYVLRANFGITVGVGRDEINPLETQVVMFPNPTTGKLSVIFGLQTAQDLTINVRDIFGRLLQTSAHNSIANDNVSIDMADLSNGMYMVEIVSDNYKMTRKIQLMK